MPTIRPRTSTPVRTNDSQPSSTLGKVFSVENNALSHAANWLNPRSYFVGAAPEAKKSRTVQEFLDQAMSRRGVSYDWGGKAPGNDNDPRKLDCSGLVNWAAKRAGVSLPEGSMQQLAATRRISVEEAMRTPGALLFKKNPNHVAISLGNGQTIEASMPMGVMVKSAAGRFTDAGIIPGLR